MKTWLAALFTAYVVCVSAYAQDTPSKEWLRHSKEAVAHSQSGNAIGPDHETVAQIAKRLRQAVSDARSEPANPTLSLQQKAALAKLAARTGSELDLKLRPTNGTARQV